MAIPAVRIRKEEFGYLLAFADGQIGYYGDEVGPVLLQGATRQDIEAHRLSAIPVGTRFHLSAPLIVWFELTRRCNLTCNHCHLSAGEPLENELSTAEILHTLDQLKALGIFSVVLAGGEPMLHPDFADIVDHAHRLGLVLSIATNGAYLTPEIADRIPREECIVCISAEGVQFHSELRPGSSFAEVQAGALLLRGKGIPTALMATLTDRNLEELREVFSFARDNDIFFGTTPFTAIGRGAAFPELEPGLDLVAEAAGFFMEEKRHENKMMETVGLCVGKFLDESYLFSQKTRRGLCGLAMAYIASDGRVYPCPTCASASSFLAGNLRDLSFADIWEHSFREIRSYTFGDFKQCEKCELSGAEYGCTSRCPVLAQVYTGDSRGCGATPYIKASLRFRTMLVQESLRETACSAGDTQRRG